MVERNIPSATAKNPQCRGIAVIGNDDRSMLNLRGELIRRFAKTGHRVYVCAPSFQDRVAVALANLGAKPVRIPLNRLGLNPLRDTVNMVRLSRVLEELHVNVVFSYFAKPVVFGTIAARLAGVRQRYCLVAGLGSAFVRDPDSHSIGRLISRIVLFLLYHVSMRLCTKVFFQNLADREYFIRARMVSSRKAVRVNGTGVNLVHFAAKYPSPKVPTFTFIGRLLKEKGILDFVSAARIARRHLPNLRFVVVGPVDINPSAVTLEEVRSWVSEGLVEYAGEVDDVRDWLGKSTALILPSYYREGVPRSLQEALATGLPVITTSMPGCRDTVVHGYNGFVVPTRSPAVLADYILQLSRDPKLVHAMGIRSRQLAEARFDVHTINTVMLQEMGLTS